MLLREKEDVFLDLFRRYELDPFGWCQDVLSEDVSSRGPKDIVDGWIALSSRRYIYYTTVKILRTFSISQRFQYHIFSACAMTYSVFAVQFDDDWASLFVFQVTFDMDRAKLSRSSVINRDQIAFEICKAELRHSDKKPFSTLVKVEYS